MQGSLKQETLRLVRQEAAQRRLRKLASATGLDYGLLHRFAAGQPTIDVDDCQKLYETLTNSKLVLIDHVQ